MAAGSAPIHEERESERRQGEAQAAARTKPRRAAALDPQPRRRPGAGGTLGRGGSRAGAPPEHG